MRARQKFTDEELNEIESSKQILMQIPSLDQHLPSWTESIKEIEAELENLGCRRAKLSEMPGNGCKPRGCSTAREIHIEEMIDEQKELIRKIKKADAELTKIVKTLHKMPTKLYSEILIKMYVTRTKTTQRDWNLRRYHINNAYLEFYHTWENKE